MSRLAEIQSYFRTAVVDGDTRSVSHVLIGGCDPEKRLTVHQRNYQASLIDSLLVKFPATGWLIGTPLLTEAAKHFAREHPPQAPCIAEYGAAFPDFLARCPETQRLPYLRNNEHRRPADGGCCRHGRRASPLHADRLARFCAKPSYY